jgi:HEAT repeat protein
MTTTTEKLIQIAADGFYSQAFNALGALGGDDALNYLLLQSQDPAHTSYTVSALAEIGTQAAIDRLLELAIDSNEYMRAQVYNALADSGWSGSVDFLFNAYTTETSSYAKSTSVNALRSALRNAQ